MTKERKQTTRVRQDNKIKNMKTEYNKEAKEKNKAKIRREQKAKGVRIGGKGKEETQQQGRSRIIQKKK